MADIIKTLMRIACSWTTVACRPVIYGFIASVALCKYVHTLLPYACIYVKEFLTYHSKKPAFLRRMEGGPFSY